MIKNLTHQVVRTFTDLTRRADAALARQAAANAATSLSALHQRNREGELALRHLDPPAGPGHRTPRVRRRVA